MDKFFFPLRDGYYFGRRLNKELRDVLGNKLVQDAHATGLLCQAVVNSGDGDCIEIGSLYGGSAITVALVKNEFNLGGRILCIDPSPRDIIDNAKMFSVNHSIDIIKANSEDVVLKKDFSCAFIDGDHRNPHPIKDFWLIEPIVKKYILFDDYDKSERGVQQAVEMVLSDYINTWRLVHFSNAIAIFERI